MDLKIAFVYDRINKIGGAERILLALHEIWPQAPFYTSVYSPHRAFWAKDLNLQTSFLQKIPFFRNRHELIPYFMPLSFESFNFDAYDLVISITSAEAKGIITKPQTCHLCYCLTPTRYLYSEKNTYLDKLKSGYLGKIKTVISCKILNYLINWDQIAAFRPDYYLSISKEVQKRIKLYYQQDSYLIYPPIEEIFHQTPLPKTTNDVNKPFFLIVSRLVPYKRIDIAIKAFNRIDKDLIIIGRGSELKNLKKIASQNIHFITGHLTDEELIGYYQRCIALIFPGTEDFGLTPIEAQACGKPVIAYRKGGVLETVIEKITGEFFSPQTPEALCKVVQHFDPSKYSQKDCRDQSLNFKKEVFKENFKKTVYNLYQQYKQERRL